MKNEALANGKSLEVRARSAAQFRSEAEPQLPEIAFSLFHPTGFVIRSGAPEKICFIAISNVCRFMFSLRAKIFRLLTFASQRHEWNYFLLKVPLNGPPNRYLRLHNLVLHLVYRANWKFVFGEQWLILVAHFLSLASWLCAELMTSNQISQVSLIHRGRSEKFAKHFPRRFWEADQRLSLKFILNIFISFLA